MADRQCGMENREAAAEAIRQMNEDDLRYLNRLIVERLKLIAQARSTVLLAQFSVGDRVRFKTPTGEHKIGIILRLNKKTVTISTDDSQHWKVYPGFLTPAVQTREIQQRQARHN